MDEKKRKQTIILGVLGVVLVGFLAYQFLLPKGPDPIEQAAAEAAAKGATAPGAPAAGARAPKPGPTTLVMADVDADELLQGIQQVSFDYQQQKIDRNPMEPLVGRFETGGGSDVPVPRAGDVVSKNVTGIVWDANSPSAVVDNEVVTVGHTYANGVKVYAIETHRVIFLVGDSLVPVDMKEL